MKTSLATTAALLAALLATGCSTVVYEDDEPRDDAADADAPELTDDADGPASLPDAACDGDCDPEHTGGDPEPEDPRGEPGPAVETSAIGNFEDFGFTRIVYPDIAFGHRVTLDESRTLQSLDLLSGGAGPVVRMALYDAQTGAMVSMAEADSLGAAMDVTAFAVEPVELAPGDYWVVVQTGEPTPLRGTMNGDTNHELVFLDRGFEDGLPAVLTEHEVIEDYAYNLFIVVGP